MSNAPRPQRRTLILLLVMFFLPLAASFLLYYVFDWRPAATSIHGELINPPRPLPVGTDALSKDWALVYVGDGACDEDCRTALVFARQTRLSLNKDMQRVNRALLSTGNCCDDTYLKQEHDGIKVIDVSAPDQLTAFMAIAPGVDLRHSLLVIDPLGNLVMSYDVRKEPKGLLDDLRKLLKLSHIG